MLFILYQLIVIYYLLFRLLRYLALKEMDVLVRFKKLVYINLHNIYDSKIKFRQGGQWHWYFSTFFVEVSSTNTASFFGYMWRWRYLPVVLIVWFHFLLSRIFLELKLEHNYYMVAYFCHHMSVIYVDLADHYHHN